MPQILVSPSILSADLLNLRVEISNVEKAGADSHHIDVMDGHFVPNLTFGLPLINALKKIAAVPLDVHLMIERPEEMIDAYLKAGADYLSFHCEAATHPHRMIQKIKNYGAKSGVALNPGTSLELIKPLLHDVDRVLVMSVNPGFSGQQFIPQVIEKVSSIREYLSFLKRDAVVTIQVDGGINDQTIKKICKAGANSFVAGSYIYGAEDRKIVIDKLRASVRDIQH